MEGKQEERKEEEERDVEEKGRKCVRGKGMGIERERKR